MTKKSTIAKISEGLQAAEAALAEAQLIGPEKRQEGGTENSDYAVHIWETAMLAQYDFKKEIKDLQKSAPTDWAAMDEGGVIDAVAAVASTLFDFLWDHDYFVEWDGKYPRSKPAFAYYDKWERNELHYMVGSVAQGGDWTDGLDNTRRVASALRTRLNKALELAIQIKEGTNADIAF